MGLGQRDLPGRAARSPAGSARAGEPNGGGCVMAWEQGRATVENLITTGMLERVPPNLSAAQSLVEVAETHLASALTLAETDTVLAYDALHGVVDGDVAAGSGGSQALGEQDRGERLAVGAVQGVVGQHGVGLGQYQRGRQVGGGDVDQ